MEARVYFSPAEVKEDRLRGRTAVVLDVLRASTTIATALANGARGVIPADSLESATEMVVKLGVDDVLLGAEWEGHRVDGCDLGNSPAEYTAEAVEGRLIVLATTNGTRAITRVRSAARVLVGCYANAARVTEALASEREPVILCAGHGGGFALEDAACAGFLLSRVQDLLGSEVIPVNDGAWVALQLGKRAPRSPVRLLRQSVHGRHLTAEGFSADLDLCGAVDSLPVLPVLDGGMLTPAV